MTLKKFLLYCPNKKCNYEIMVDSSEKDAILASFENKCPSCRKRVLKININWVFN